MFNTEMITDNHILVFDLDDTLIETSEANFLSYQYAIKKVTGVVVKCNHQQRFTRKTLLQLFPKISDLECRRIISLKQMVYDRYLSQTKINNKLLKIINQYKDKNMIILATNSCKNRATLLLDYYGIRHLFSYSCYKEDLVGKKKILFLQRFLQCDTKQFIYFEDNKDEIEYAEKCGVILDNIIFIQK